MLNGSTVYKIVQGLKDNISIKPKDVLFLESDSTNWVHVRDDICVGDYILNGFEEVLFNYLIIVGVNQDRVFTVYTFDRVSAVLCLYTVGYGVVKQGDGIDYFSCVNIIVEELRDLIFYEKCEFFIVHGSVMGCKVNEDMYMEVYDCDKDTPWYRMCNKNINIQDVDARYNSNIVYPAKDILMLLTRVGYNARLYCECNGSIKIELDLLRHKFVMYSRK